MKRLYYFPSILRGEGDEDKITLTKEELDQKIQDAVSKAEPEIDHQKAADFIKNHGGHVFLNDDSLKRAQKDAIKASVGHYETGLRKKIKDQFGVDWSEDDKTVEDYLTKVISTKAAESSKNNEELTGLKNLLKEKETKNSELVKQLNDLNVKTFQNSIENEIDSSLSEFSFAYEDKFVENSVKKNLKSDYKSKFKHDKDEDGVKVVDVATGGVQLASDGRRLKPGEVFKKFVESNKEIKLGNANKKPNVPGTGSGGGDDQKQAKEKAKEEMREKGLYGQEKEAWEIRKKHGLVIPDPIKKQFNL